MQACDIDVLILAGGLGTRLKSVVSDRPKPMAEIEGRPFLELLVEHVMSFGFRRFLLGIGHMAEAVEESFSRCKLDAEIVFVKEDEPLGTGGAVVHAREDMNSDPVIIMNGDSFCPIDLSAMLDYHASKKSEATVALVKVQNAADYGSVDVDEQNGMRSFEEKKKAGETGLVNAGVYILQQSAIELMKDKVPLSLEKEVFPTMVGRRFYGYPVDGPLLDIGTPDRYEKAQSDLMKLMKLGN